MAESAYFARLAIRSGDLEAAAWHSAVVRVAHWVNALSFLGLLVSGIAILLAHPRLYWGETGAVGMPSLLDLPLPFVLTGQTGWGRYLHFLSAWICVIAGSVYVIHGLVARHFERDFLPAAEPKYGSLQRLTYLAVVFALFPLAIWTGLAMSPAITSVFPAVVTILGGQQSARTMHFCIASLLVVFLFVHVAMVCATGFKNQMRGMITGVRSEGEE
jgi:thiosulfate reductase cytochrome b subunit